MAKADSVLSTPPTTASAIDHPMMFPPRDPTRRRFLAVAAVGFTLQFAVTAAVVYTLPTRLPPQPVTLSIA